MKVTKPSQALEGRICSDQSMHDKLDRVPISFRESYSPSFSMLFFVFQYDVGPEPLFLHRPYKLSPSLDTCERTYLSSYLDHASEPWSYCISQMPWDFARGIVSENSEPIPEHNLENNVACSLPFPWSEIPFHRLCISWQIPLDISHSENPLIYTSQSNISPVHNMYQMFFDSIDRPLYEVFSLSSSSVNVIDLYTILAGENYDT